MTTEEIVELVRGTIVDEASPGSDTVAMYYSSPGVLSTIPYESVARAVVAALREAGRLVPEGCVAVDRGTYDAAVHLAWNTDADVHCALLRATGDNPEDYDADMRRWAEWEPNP